MWINLSCGSGIVLNSENEPQRQPLRAQFRERLERIASLRANEEEALIR